MKFVSTRGRAPALSFSDAVLTGLARDGGLYVPESWPQISPEEIEGMADGDYAAIAAKILYIFMEGELPSGDPKTMPRSELVAMADEFGRYHSIVDEAYASFRHPSVTPLVEIGPAHYVLELFHGPTLAFKDVAMQLLARLVDDILRRRGERATIVGATSGDTGSAAIEAFRGRDNVDIFIMHPKDRTSDVQRRQMTTVLDENVHNIAIEGTFDDCQRLLKGLFNNLKFRDEVKLSGVNSINWGRIVPQIAYYFKAAAVLGGPHRDVAFTVPTGNFGDIFAGYAAKRMGLPVRKLVIATNENDILRRTLESGRYETAEVRQTSSPSMDIQVSSNFERLLFEAVGRDGATVQSLMDGLGQSGAFTIPPAALDKMRADFSAATTDEATTIATIAKTFKDCGYLLDPHTAVGVSVARRFATGGAPMITLATAHPAKFPAAVKAATGIEPQLPLWLADLQERPERYDILGNDQGEVESYILARARA
jgi:threonine synthase